MDPSFDDDKSDNDIISLSYEAYKEYEFTWNYFSIVNPNILNVTRDELSDYSSVTPENFELMTGVILDEVYEAMLSLYLVPNFRFYTIGNLYSGDLHDTIRDKLAKYNMSLNQEYLMLSSTYNVGWTKSDIREAIRASGLLIDRKEAKEKYNKDSRCWDPLNYIKDNDGKLLNAPGFNISDLPSKIYYLTLYRYIFSTQKRTNLNLTYEKYQKGKLTDSLFSKIIQLRTGIDIDHVKDLTPAAKIQFIKDCLSIREIGKKAALEAIEIAPELIYQPGSYWTRPTGANTMKDLPNFQPMKNKIQEINKDNIDQLLKELDINIKPGLTNDLMCKIVTNHLKILSDAIKP